MTRRRDPNPLDDPARFAELPPDHQTALIDWIGAHVVPARTVWRGQSLGGGYATSYGLKHTFQAHTGIYVYNGAFKGGMLACGHTPVDANEQNWSFRIRPAYRHALRGKDW